MPPPRSPGPSASGWSRVEARTTCALRDTRPNRWRPGILRPRPKAERLARRPSAPAATARHSRPSAVSRSIYSSAVLARRFCQQPVSSARGAGGGPAQGRAASRGLRLSSGATRPSLWPVPNRNGEAAEQPEAHGLQILTRTALQAILRPMCSPRAHLRASHEEARGFACRLAMRLFFSRFAWPHLRLHCSNRFFALSCAGRESLASAIEGT
jgi:hypothetical protein